MADKDMKWKTLSQKYLIEKPWLTARVDKVELPTGAIIDEYYVLEYPDWVNTIAITKEGEFIFVRQYRYAIGKTVNELCAGVIEKPWLTARVDKVELPTGAIIDEYYVLEYPDWVNTIAITKDGMFVFVRQYRYAIGKTVNELCAGVVEKDEDPMDAAKRELMEETGFGGGNWQKWMTISANPSTHTNLTHCYLATDVERMDVQHLDQAEDIEVRLFSREEVMDMLEKGEIWQSLMAAPLWKYFAKAK